MAFPSKVSVNEIRGTPSSLLLCLSYLFFSLHKSYMGQSSPASFRVLHRLHQIYDLIYDETIDALKKFGAVCDIFIILLFWFALLYLPLSYICCIVVFAYTMIRGNFLYVATNTFPSRILTALQQVCKPHKLEVGIRLFRVTYQSRHNEKASKKARFLHLCSLSLSYSKLT